MDEWPLSRQDSFEETTNSLDRKKDKKPPSPMRHETSRSPVFDTRKLEDWLRKTYGTRLIEPHENIRRINSILNTQLALNQETQAASRTVQVLRQLNTHVECESPILERVMSEIESRIEGEPEWKRTVVLGGLKVSWIVARNLIPGFSGAERVMNAIESGDFKELAVGMVRVGVEIAPFECFSWLLLESVHFGM